MGSWANDYLFRPMWKVTGDYLDNFYSVGHLWDNDLSRFFAREFSDKAELRGAQEEAALSGIPILGDFLRGVGAIQQMDDLYNRTGKTAAYSANQNLGAAALGYGGAAASQLIRDGTTDLYQYYAGVPDGMENIYR